MVEIGFVIDKGVDICYSSGLCSVQFYNHICFEVYLQNKGEKRMKYEGLRRGLAGGFGAVIGLLFAKYLGWPVVWGALVAGAVAFVGYDVKGFGKAVATAWKKSVAEFKKIQPHVKVWFNDTRYAGRNLSKIIIPLFLLAHFSGGESVTLESFLGVSAFFFVCSYITAGFMQLSTLGTGKFEYSKSKGVIYFYLYYSFMLVMIVLKSPVSIYNLYKKGFFGKAYAGLKMTGMAIKSAGGVFVKETAKLFLSVGRLSSFVFAVAGMLVGAFYGMSLLIGFLAGFGFGLVCYEVAYWINFDKIEI